MKIQTKETITNLFWMVIGNFILAISVSWFILPNDILTGGLAGIAVAFEPLLGIDPTITINVLTVVLFFIGWAFLGKRFAAQTVLSTILYPIFLNLLAVAAERYFSPDTFIMDTYLATIYGGIFMGIGVGCVFRTGASTGGMDIPPLILNKYTHISLSTLVMITDALTVMLGVAVYGFQAALTGLISVFACSFMINKTMMLGGADARNIMIISEKYEEIMDSIHGVLDRGTTILQAKGGYSQQQKPVLMVVVAKKQMPKLQVMISHIDPEAFVIVMEAKEVQGLGFTYEEEL